MLGEWLGTGADGGVLPLPSFSLSMQGIKNKGLLACEVEILS